MSPTMDNASGFANTKRTASKAELNHEASTSVRSDAQQASYAHDCSNPNANQPQETLSKGLSAQSSLPQVATSDQNAALSLSLFYAAAAHSATTLQQDLSPVAKRPNTLGVADPLQSAQMEGPLSMGRASQPQVPSAIAPSATSSKGSPLVNEPRNQDVLFGRGRHHRDNPGNKRMQLIVDIHRDTYYRTDREGKTDITKGIVKIIKAQGNRFLKLDKDSNVWEEVDDETARHKIGHAMRDGRTRPSGPVDPQLLEGVVINSEELRRAVTRMMLLCKQQNSQVTLAADEANILKTLLAGSDTSADEGSANGEGSAKSEKET